MRIFMIYKSHCIFHTNFMRRKIHIGLLSGFFILLIFSVVLTPVCADPDLLSILEQGNFTDDQKENIRKVFEEAEGKGIPSAFIIPRLEEGIAKKVPFSRLINVLANEVGYLEQARELLILVDPDLDLLKKSSIWLRTALLFSKNISFKTIRAIVFASISRWDDFRDATVLYLSLIQWGLTDDKALLVVESMLKSSIPGEDFIGLINIFTRGRSLRISPEEIINRMKEVIDETETIETLEEKILY